MGMEAILNACNNNLRDVKAHLKRECPNASRSAIEYAMKSIKNYLKQRAKQRCSEHITFVNNIVEVNFLRGNRDDKTI